jgi:hypothetical protein
VGDTVAVFGAGRATPSLLVSHDLGLDEAPAAYEKFDQRADGYTKVLLHPGRIGWCHAARELGRAWLTALRGARRAVQASRAGPGRYRPS